MLWKDGQPFSAMAIGGKMVATMYYQGAKIWGAIRSCFGTGVWLSAKPWIGSDTWRNN